MFAFIFCLFVLCVCVLPLLFWRIKMNKCMSMQKLDNFRGKIKFRGRRLSILLQNNRCRGSV